MEKEWFDHGDWNEGLQINIHPSVDVSEFYRQYHKRPDLWKAAFEYLKKDLTSAETGKCVLKENEAIADKYEVTWSSLFVNGWKDGKENVNNMTEFSFSNAKNAPDKFKEGIKSKIDELLKQL